MAVMMMHEIPTNQPGIRRLFNALKLDRLEPHEVLLRYDHPALMRSHAQSMGVKVSFKLCEDVLKFCGWERPENYIDDPLIAPQARRSLSYKHGERVPVSKYAVEIRVGDIVRYERPGHPIATAKVLESGKFQSLDWPDADPMTPSMWARRAQGRCGHMSVMPKVFWKYVKVVPAEPKMPEASELEGPSEFEV